MSFESLDVWSSIQQISSSTWLNVCVIFVCFLFCLMNYARSLAIWNKLHRVLQQTAEWQEACLKKVRVTGYTHGMNSQRKRDEKRVETYIQAVASSSTETWCTYTFVSFLVLMFVYGSVWNFFDCSGVDSKFLSASVHYTLVSFGCFGLIVLYLRRRKAITNKQIVRRTHLTANIFLLVLSLLFLVLFNGWKAQQCSIPSTKTTEAPTLEEKGSTASSASFSFQGFMEGMTIEAIKTSFAGWLSTLAESNSDVIRHMFDIVYNAYDNVVDPSTDHVSPTFKVMTSWQKEQQANLSALQAENINLTIALHKAHQEYRYANASVKDLGNAVYGLVHRINQSIANNDHVLELNHDMRHVNGILDHFIRNMSDLKQRNHTDAHDTIISDLNQNLQSINDSLPLLHRSVVRFQQNQSEKSAQMFILDHNINGLSTLVKSLSEIVDDFKQQKIHDRFVIQTLHETLHEKTKEYHANISALNQSFALTLQYQKTFQNLTYSLGHLMQSEMYQCLNNTRHFIYYYLCQCPYEQIVYIWNKITWDNMFYYLPFVYMITSVLFFMGVMITLCVMFCTGAHLRKQALRRRRKRDSNPRPVPASSRASSDSQTIRVSPGASSHLPTLRKSPGALPHSQTLRVSPSNIVLGLESLAQRDGLLSPVGERQPSAWNFVSSGLGFGLGRNIRLFSNQSQVSQATTIPADVVEKEKPFSPTNDDTVELQGLPPAGNDGAVELQGLPPPADDNAVEQEGPPPPAGNDGAPPPVPANTRKRPREGAYDTNQPILCEGGDNHMEDAETAPPSGEGLASRSSSRSSRRKVG